jgi:hypothetical protein
MFSNNSMNSIQYTIKLKNVSNGQYNIPSVRNIQVAFKKDGEIHILE